MTRKVEARLQFLEKYAAALSIASPLAGHLQPEPANAGHLTVSGAHPCQGIGRCDSILEPA